MNEELPNPLQLRQALQFLGEFAQEKLDSMRPMQKAALLLAVQANVNVLERAIQHCEHNPTLK